MSEKYFSIYFYNNGKYTKYLKNTAADIKVVAEGTDNLKKWALQKAVEKVRLVVLCLVAPTWTAHALTRCVKLTCRYYK